MDALPPNVPDHPIAAHVVQERPQEPISGVTPDVQIIAGGTAYLRTDNGGEQPAPWQPSVPEIEHHVSQRGAAAPFYRPQ
jgi:hypothetical protein